jgi:prepilin-type N-terminal cleavage/methylation domain-containing protein
MKIIKTAFTLIELLVVIAIIGILSGLIVVTMSGVSDKANIAKSQVFSNSLRNSLMLNLVSEWKLDGNANDSWGSNNGSFNSAPVSSTNCVYNTCYSFDGVDDYISVSDSNSLDVTDGITLEAWVNIASLQNNNYEYIIRKTAEDIYQRTLYGLLMGYSNATVGFFLWTEDYAGCQQVAWTSSSLALSKWYHLVGTYDYPTHTGKIYINGAFATSGTSVTGRIRTNNNALYLGHKQDGTLYFNGLMDNMRVYNSAIPTSQIEEMYYAGLNNLLKNKAISIEEYLAYFN